MATSNLTPTKEPSSSQETSVLSSNSSTLLAPSLSKPVTPFQQPTIAHKNGSCTHLTMTRLYTTEFRCNVCWQHPTIGWIYRCTQDRELMLEDQLEKGCEENFDALSDIFPRSTTPRKRGPAARASNLSFLEEISDEDMKSYSKEQLTLILSQRANALNVATRDSVILEPDDNIRSSILPADRSPSSPSPNYSSSPSRISNKPVTKPWMPTEECQFKCCHYCRPTLVERTFLSLDGILKNDVPPTAITGFGFHLQKRRPVSPFEVVKNIGLRPSPEPRNLTSAGLARRQGTYSSGRLRDIGLGLVDTASDSPFVPRPLPEPPLTTSSTEPACNESLSQAYNYKSFAATLEDYAITTQIPPPPQSLDELPTTSTPLTPMEQNEIDGSFGSEPLKVVDGIAVTEEAVGLHVPDLITQL